MFRTFALLSVLRPHTLPARTPAAALTVLLVLSLGAPAFAQGGRARLYARPGRPLQTHTLDLASGTLSRGLAPRDRSAATVSDFSNLDLGGFLGVDTGGGFCEWFQAGTKGFAGNTSDLMSEIVFAYCSAKASVGSGGPGGSVKLGFYEGYTVFGGAPTTTVAVFTLTGLPGNSASSSFFGGFNCYFLSVQFGALVAFADGPIGYSWGFLDVGTDGALAGTWPFLACATSCSAASMGVSGFIDKYCPPGTLHSTFTFGTTSGSFTSISMDIREAKDLAATSTAYNATLTPNGDVLTATPAVVGASWSVTLTRPTSTLPGGFTLTVRTNRIALANGVQGPAPLPGGAGGRVLITGPALVSLLGTHNGRTGSVATVIPAQFGLLCVHYAAQATVLGAGVRLSSAVEGTTGTF